MQNKKFETKILSLSVKNFSWILYKYVVRSLGNNQRKKQAVQLPIDDTSAMIVKRISQLPQDLRITIGPKILDFIEKEIKKYEDEEHNDKHWDK